MDLHRSAYPYLRKWRERRKSVNRFQTHLIHIHWKGGTKKKMSNNMIGSTDRLSFHQKRQYQSERVGGGRGGTKPTPTFPIQPPITPALIQELASQDSVSHGAGWTVLRGSFMFDCVKATFVVMLALLVVVVVVVMVVIVVIIVRGLGT